MKAPEGKGSIDMKIPVTAIVSTKNEELAIGQCLESLRDFAEVFVVDSMSTDRTTDIASGLGAIVVDFEWDGRYPKKKQWCLDNLPVSHPWVFFVDADERPTCALVHEIRNICADSGEVRAYDIPLEYHFMGKRLRHGHQVVKRALMQPSHTSFPELDDLQAPGMGELEGHYQPVVAGVVGRTAASLRHDDPDPIGSWVQRHNKYSDWEAYLRHEPSVGQAIRALRSDQGRVFDALPLKPLIFFAYCYIIRAGFLDGRAGFNYALSLSWYYWLIGLKLRELTERPAAN